MSSKPPGKTPQAGTVRLASNVEVFYPPHLFKQSVPPPSAPSTSTTTALPKNVPHPKCPKHRTISPRAPSFRSATARKDARHFPQQGSPHLASSSAGPKPYARTTPKNKTAPAAVKSISSPTPLYPSRGNAVRKSATSAKPFNQSTNARNRLTKQPPIKQSSNGGSGSATLSSTHQSSKAGNGSGASPSSYRSSEAGNGPAALSSSYQSRDRSSDSAVAVVYDGSDCETSPTKIPRRTSTKRKLAQGSHPSTSGRLSGRKAGVTLHVEPVSMDVEMEAPVVTAPPDVVTPVTPFVEPMDVDAASIRDVQNLRAHEDYLGLIPTVSGTFNIPDVEMIVPAEQCLILDTNIIVGHGGKIWKEFLHFMTGLVPTLTKVQVRIPHMVLVELDKLKQKRGTPVAWAANQACRDINGRFRALDGRFVGQTVGQFQATKSVFSPLNNDDCILACCLQAQADFPNAVFFVTDDINFQNRIFVQKHDIKILNGAQLRVAMESFLKPAVSVPVTLSPESTVAASVCRNLSGCVEALLLTTLSDFVKQHLQQVYGRDLWEDIIKGHLPPWTTVSQVVRLIEKHRSGAFIEVKREDVKLLTDLIPTGPDWTDLKSPDEEMLRLAEFLGKAISALECLNKLDRQVAVASRASIQSSLALLRAWEVTRRSVQSNRSSVDSLAEHVAHFGNGEANPE